MGVLVRFGVFEWDLPSRELRKRGIHSEAPYRGQARSIFLSEAA